MNRHIFRALFHDVVPETVDRTFTLIPLVPSNVVQTLEIRNPKLIYKAAEDMDAVLCMIDHPQVPLHPDIRKHFASAIDLSKCNHDTRSGIVVHGTDLKPSFTVAEQVKRTQGTHTIYEKDEIYMECNKPFLYRGACVKKGTCGALLIVSINGRPRIIGMHIAGSDKEKRGVIQPIHERLLGSDYALGKPVYECQGVSLEWQDDVVPGAYNITPNEITCSFKTSACDKTNFVPTPLIDCDILGPCKVRPTVMNNTTLELGLTKERKRDHCRTAHPDAVVIARKYAQEMTQAFIPLDLSTLSCKPLTTEEILCDHPELNPFSPTTSDGIRLKIQGITKEQVMGYTDSVGIYHPPDPRAREIFETTLNKYIRRSEKGIFYYQINADKQKDETLPSEFVDAGTARIFNITDFYDNCLIKRVIGPIIAKTHEVFLVGPQTCGVNIRGSIARLIYAQFFGKDIMAADVSGFDYCVSEIVMPMLSLLICLAYASRVHRMQAYWAILSVLHAIRFNLGKGRFRGCGNTSGNWITTWLNTACNLVFFYTAVIWLALKNGFEPREVISKISLRLYSDDNLFYPHYSWITPDALREAFWHLFKVELTGTDKGPFKGPCIRIDQAEFLSRTFREHAGQVYTPLALPSLLTFVFVLALRASQYSL
jgi:hypothetical protein